MKILFISKYHHPHIGGVEKHVFEVSRLLKQKGHSVISIGSDKNSDYPLKYPAVKFVGLFKIWLELFKLRKVILSSDVIHIHDVFIWYLPFKFIFPHKKVFVTFHGWEGKYPIPFLNKLQKKLAVKLSNGTVAVGKYVGKYYEIKPDYVVYGAVSRLSKTKYPKVVNSIVFLGRLEEDTGLVDFLVSLKSSSYKVVTFVGDGPLKDKCKKYGKVVGFSDPTSYLQKTEYCVPGGYLSYLEALNINCKVVTYASIPLKVDYWNEIKKAIPTKKELPTWNDITDLYLKLWSRH